ncbi:hypothetical protein CA11_33260 [Gimesia maris]|uniref:hypothetical protein n=1 Tax=Gimesia maris TaxID=122 RepID=UPI001189E761|nr:hypothetical protein [Gimesia maris]QDU15501.1 hypothetical protein CA11_33260 [Gimesia maris]
MKGTYEGFELYQTVAQEGVPYPTEPAQPDILTQVENAPNVWHVKKLTNAKYTVRSAPGVNGIGGDDTGKTHKMFVMGNGPVYGYYTKTKGMVRAYLPEGTYLAGWWDNGQLFGVPLTESIPTVTRTCNISVYPVNATAEEELFFYNRMVESNTDILLVHSLNIGGAGQNYTSGCTWQPPLYPGEEDEDNQFIEFLKTGRSIVVSGEMLTRPLEYFWEGDYGPCFEQSDCDAANDFFASIGGLATLSPADLSPPAAATDSSGVHCFTGGIVADAEHPFCLDENGDQNVFYFQVRGSAKVTANGSTELAYLWDSGTGTDSNNCLMAGNQYDATNAGWVFMVGDADMIRSEVCYGPDMSVMFANICRLQNGHKIPTA